MGRLARHHRFPRSADLSDPTRAQMAALRALGRTQMRLPGSLPSPDLAEGTDTIPQIEHVVVLMMENHSYDNFFGMLGRGPRERPRGDGFALASDGYPKATNPYPNGTQLRAFRMPTTCQLDGKPSQEWVSSHVQYANGQNNGFVISDSGPVAMGYWQRQDLPFTYDLATQFPIGDRWFCSVLGQTDPNRRYLLAATSSGMTDDVPDPSQDATLFAMPPGGTIFSRLSDAGISWAEYDVQYQDITAMTMNLYPSVDSVYEESNERSITQFYSAAAAGMLPSFSLIDPNFDTQSQENPQNIVVGEAFLRSVVEAIGSSPAWRKTLLIITYDEHGGYYDHVPPPPALAPDSIQPVVQPGESTYDGFTRYGFRVPSVVVGPYAKRNHVSHVVYDHSSICAFVERKWNLQAMTYRDANANDLTDFLDLGALASGNPTFPELPKLAASGDTAATLACSTTGPGQIPPPPPPAPTVELRYRGIKRRLHGIAVELHTSQGTMSNLSVQLYHGRHRVARHHVAHLTPYNHRVILRSHGAVPAPGHYTVLVRRGRHTLARRKIRVR